MDNTSFSEMCVAQVAFSRKTADACRATGWEEDAAAWDLQADQWQVVADHFRSLAILKGEGGL